MGHPVRPRLSRALIANGSAVALIDASAGVASAQSLDGTTFNGTATVTG